MKKSTNLMERKGSWVLPSLYIYLSLLSILYVELYIRRESSSFSILLFSVLCFASVLICKTTF